MAVAMINMLLTIVSTSSMSMLIPVVNMLTSKKLSFPDLHESD